MPDTGSSREVDTVNCEKEPSSKLSGGSDEESKQGTADATLVAPTTNMAAHKNFKKVKLHSESTQPRPRSIPIHLVKTSKRTGPDTLLEDLYFTVLGASKEKGHAPQKRTLFVNEAKNYAIRTRRCGTAESEIYEAFCR